MSIYSDHDCNAMTDQEFRNACARENRKERQFEDMQELEEERKEHLKDLMCKNFCKFPDMYSMTHGEDRQDRMHNEVCDICPLNDL